jgi:putative ABC transport system permease protein
VDRHEIVNANILIRTPGPSAAAVPPLRQLLVRLSRDGTYTRVATLREAQLGTFERLTRMALAVGAVVLALAAVGLYGAVSFYTSQRRREIAIRAALGAPRQRVLRVVAREAVAVVAAGAVLGLLLSAIAFRYMSGMLFAQWTLDPVLVGGVTAVFAVTTLAACFVPLRRALGIDPMSVLKSD